MAKTYNIGPKLGDFIHGLVIPSYIYSKTGEKAIIYISNEGCTFTLSLEDTYNQLKPILEQQSFIEDFKIYKGEKCDYDLFTFRQSPNIFRIGWTELYFNKFLNIVPPKDFAWLSYPPERDTGIVINRSIRHMHPDTLEWYTKFLSENKATFICSDRAQYEAFPLKEKLDMKLCPRIIDLFVEIAGSEQFVGNQSAPLAIASALGKNRIGELRRGPDAPHYSEDRKYNKNLKTFIGD